MVPRIKGKMKDEEVKESLPNCFEESGLGKCLDARVKPPIRAPVRVAPSNNHKVESRVEAEGEGINLKIVVKKI